MVRLTFSHHFLSIRTAIWTRSVTLAAIALIAFLGADSAGAVTKTQLENSAAEIQNLSRTIDNEQDHISALEKDIWALDKQILETRKGVREERIKARNEVFDAKRDLKRQEITIDQIKKDIALVDSDIEINKRDTKRDQQRYTQLNVLKQSLEEGDFKKRQADFERQLAVLLEKRKPLQTELEEAQAKLDQLKQQMSSVESDVDDSSLDKDPRINALLQKRSGMSASLIALRNQVKSDGNRLASLQDSYKSLNAQFKRELAARAAANNKVADKPAPAPSVAADFKLDRTDYASYVFVVSGEQDPDIEQTLRLKNWVESYGAKYIQASWNGIGARGPKSMEGFMEAFRSYIRQIPKDAKIVLIGHGLGGGAAIEAATQVAFNESRAIDFLAVLDPIGDRNLRANIVYNTDGSACNKPDPKDEMTNSDYVECIRNAKKRLITSNIKYFYNRWQKDAEGPLDYQREIPSLDSKGKVVSVPTATGRFAIAKNTDSDQKRLYFAGDKNAHSLLLAEEAKQLPKLLVQHLR